MKTIVDQAGQTIHSYNLQASKYEQKWENYLLHTYKRLIQVFECRKEDRVLDISAGTGLFAKNLLENHYHPSEFVLNDISGKMLELARKRFEEVPIVSFAEDHAEDLHFEKESFDVVVSLNAFHNYTGQEKAISEIHRVLKPGGLFYVLDWNNKGFFKWINFFIKAFSKEVIQTKSAEGISDLLQGHKFNLQHHEEWNYSYWKFYLMVAQK